MDSQSAQRDTILIVEDSLLDAETLKRSLHSHYNVVVAVHPMEALDYISNTKIPDLILLDIVMPELDGFEFCKRLKEEKNTKDLPIIFITAQTDTSYETKALEYGAVDYITKPVNIPVAKIRIKTHLVLKKKRELLENLSFTDNLTAIPNRRKFDYYLDLEWPRAIREQIPFSLMLIDVDDFKKYNDCHGHPAGDQCLKRLALALSEVVFRPTDLLARYGGEEFAIILPNTGTAGVSFLSKMIQKRLELLNIPHTQSSVCDRLTVSMGGATMIPTPNSILDELIGYADQALYKAKREGKNRFYHIDLRNNQHVYPSHIPCS